MIEEKFASGKSLIHQLDPKIRIIASIILSFAVALCDNLYIAGLYFIISSILIAMAKLKWRDVVNRLKPLLWFLLMIWIILPLTFDGETLYQYSWLRITGPGVILCCKITIKSITILLIFTGLIATMTVASLGNGLHRLYVPDKMVFLLLMSYRYISVIEEEYKRLLRAAKFRGFSPKTNLHSYKTFAYLAGMLFVRASVRAQRVYQAMLCRGFNQKFHTLDVYPPNRLNSIFLIGIFAASLSLVIFEITWT
ncbi:MAG: cobalt ECF transporter T component CbiQ [Desulfobacterales bacterium]|nr:cobalt ECF transporter T component CbiQ [Desulfobacterales bacterium]